jgi:ribosomal protein L24E
MNAAVAQHLNVAESAIVRIEEWAHVLFVVCKKLGARFVSKKVIKVEQRQPKEVRWTVQGHQAVAKQLTKETAKYADLIGWYEVYTDGKFSIRVEPTKFLAGIAKEDQSKFEFIY